MTLLEGVLTPDSTVSALAYFLLSGEMRPASTGVMMLEVGNVESHETSERRAACSRG
jgi:hypothetical protein